MPEVAANCANTVCVPSVDPSSTTIISTSGRFCARTLATALATKAAPLKTGITTLTMGLCGATDTLRLVHHVKRRGIDLVDGNQLHAILFASPAGRMKTDTTIQALIDRMGRAAPRSPLPGIGRAKQCDKRSSHRRGDMHGPTVIPDEQDAPLHDGGILQDGRPPRYDRTGRACRA